MDYMIISNLWVTNKYAWIWMMMPLLKAYLVVERYVHCFFFRNILKKRERFEYRIRKRTKQENDYLRYIQVILKARMIELYRFNFVCLAWNVHHGTSCMLYILLEVRTWIKLCKMLIFKINMTGSDLTLYDPQTAVIDVLIDRCIWFLAAETVLTNEVFVLLLHMHGRCYCVLFKKLVKQYLFLFHYTG